MKPSRKIWYILSAIASSNYKINFLYIKQLGIADQPNTCSLDQDAMQQRAVILKRILDAKIERETQALYALQALIHKLEHPNSKYLDLGVCCDKIWNKRQVNFRR